MNSNNRCSVNKQTAQIRKVLEKLYARYNHRHLIKPDPLQFVYQYSEPEDMEIAGFLASSLAYGRVQQIEKSVTGLLKLMGNSPFNFVRNFDKNKRDKIKGFRHRFNTGDDISNLLDLLRGVLIEFESIENFFVQGYNSDDKNVIAALSKFCDCLLNRYAETHGGNIPRGLSYLLARPISGSACKRLNLFLRWMVRKDDIDSGLWKSIDKSKLVVPIDVHMNRLCRILGFHNRKTSSLSTTIQITESFANIEPSDPVRYDFALSRIGIVENCNGKFRRECKDCGLIGFCTG